MASMMITCLVVALVGVPFPPSDSTESDISRALRYSHDRLPLDVVMNGNFELVADSTTDPVKYGSYWKGAFVPKPDDPNSQVEELSPGEHVLRLTPDHPAISQILTLYGPYAIDFLLSLRFRPVEDRATLHVDLETHGGRKIRYTISSGAVQLDGSRSTTPLPSTPDQDGFFHVTLPAGQDFANETGGPPEPWLRISLSASGADVLLDDVVGRHVVPRITAQELREMLLEDVRDTLRIYLAPPDGEGLKGLELVDPRTGYLTGSSYNVQTGEVISRSHVAAIGGIHEIMVNYILANDTSKEGLELRPLVLDRLQKHLRSILANNIYAKTGLYCLYDSRRKAQLLEAELSPNHFIRYSLSVSALFPSEKNDRTIVERTCVRMADTMVRLRDDHDLPRGKPFGRYKGGNWFGRMPEKVSPQGHLAKPKKNTYDQAWAISQNRSWYHDFDTAVGIALANRVHPRPEYQRVIQEMISHFDREWDATRYDMENDTDDHYGKNVEAALLAFRLGGREFPELVEFAQRATDYRLPRNRPWDENLWVEGIRLGSFTTGDQPRAFRGPEWLHNLPPESNPETSSFEAYRHVLREQGKADLKRRLLDDGFMTEASSYQWEMISACFKGDYIGPCSENKDWEGDMGDQFAGPSANSFRALGRVIDISEPGRDLEFIVWYALVQAHTLNTYRLPYGYRYGMPEETGKRYGIPEQYLEGFNYEIPYGLAVPFVHAETLASNALDSPSPDFKIAQVKINPKEQVEVVVSGPPGGSVILQISPNIRFQRTGTTDWRLTTADPSSGTEVKVTLDENGAGSSSFDINWEGPVAVNALLMSTNTDDVEAVATGLFDT